MDASARIKALAAEHGFPLNGLAAVPPDGVAPGADRFAEWLACGHQGPLAYLQDSAPERLNLHRSFPWARSVVCVAAFHAAGEATQPYPAPHAAGASPLLVTRVASYAHGRDYHLIFNRRLKALARALLAEDLCARARWYVDTGPLLERAWAAQAGLGWIGKNGCLIHPRGGSFLLLGEILLDVAVAPDAPLSGACGRCTRCLDACPAHALVAPGVVDARRCVVTWNLEMKGAWPNTPHVTPSREGEDAGRPRPARFGDRGRHHGWAAGCDVCQAVCPFNAPERRASPDPELAAPLAWQELTLAETLTMSRETFDRCFRASALRRAGWKGVRLGALAAAAGETDAATRVALRACLADPDSEIVQRAGWAFKA